MKRYDAIVIGGGPSGSTTAYRLAEQGASVLLADKATFPRDKPCGGGMTLRAVRQCPVDPSPVVEEYVDQIELRFRYGPTVIRTAKEPIVWMTQRKRLDAFLLDAARERGGGGARGRQGRDRAGQHRRARVGRACHRRRPRWGRRGERDHRKSVGLGQGVSYGVAYEGNVPYPTLSQERYARRIVLELADIPGGYAWVFPKGDHANVGVGGWESEGPKLREHLARCCEAHGLDPDDLESLRGHRLPLRKPGSKLALERTLVVGDAAGLVDPVSGDGMFECFVSSRLAAAAIGDLLAGRTSTLEPYTAAVDGELAPLHRASWTLKKALDRWPRASWQIARSHLLWVSIRGMLDGELPDPGKQRGLARVPLRALAILGR